MAILIKEEMKIINVIGGLGNQMFCMAFAKALKNRYQDEVLIDVSHYRYYKLHDGFQIYDIFDVVDIFVANSNQIKKISRYFPHYKLSRILRKLLPVKETEFIERQDYVYDSEALNNSGDCYYEGYWQSPLYFLDIEIDIKNMFTFPKPQSKNKDIEQRICSSNSVSIHVRRGDYLNAKSFIGICELDYYKQAISLIIENVKVPHFFIFSNDIEWCRANISSLLTSYEIEFVSHNLGVHSYWDMYLMSCCKNMIIANSSFSWWAAFLNKIDNPLIIAPSRWVNRNYNTNIHLRNWMKI